MKKSILAILSTLTLVGCGGGSSSSSSSNEDNGTPSDPFKTVKVEYTLNGSDQPTCHNAYQRSGIESNSVYMRCTWICAEYEGASPVTVGLSFEKIGGIWEFEEDTVITGPSNCHN